MHVYKKHYFCLSQDINSVSELYGQWLYFPPCSIYSLSISRTERIPVTIYVKIYQVIFISDDKRLRITP
jgi:hypothetical protein